MDRRWVALEERHSRAMEVLFAGFLDAYPDVEFDDDGELTPAGEDAWDAFSSDLLAQHQDERSTWAVNLQAEQQQRRGTSLKGMTMDADEAISLAVSWIRSRGINYPTEGLAADRFEVGWSVFAPVQIDEGDPMSFLNMPIGRSIFLVGDSGRIEETTSSVPPQYARDRFTAAERAANGTSDALMAEFRKEFSVAARGVPGLDYFTIVDAPGGDDAELSDEDATTAREALALIEPIVRQLAALCALGWEEFSAQFAFTVSSKIAQLRFWADDEEGVVPVPTTVAELVGRQRAVAARMSAGPWRRMLLTVFDDGETSVEYDYGDEPFPDDQLVAAEHYRNDLEAYPRERVPVWLAGYAAGPDAQGRDARTAATASAADAAAGRIGTVADKVPGLGELWARWAVLAAVHVGAGSDVGPRMHPGYGWFEGDGHCGSTLYVLPGERAVLSGGRWNSELLDAGYNAGQDLPDLYTGAPSWVTDSVLNARNRDGLLSFCVWWNNGQWNRGTTPTAGEYEGALPPVLSSEGAVAAMTTLTGDGTEDLCAVLLAAATEGGASRDTVAAVFADNPDADIAAAADQLSLAGLLVD